MKQRDANRGRCELLVTGFIKRHRSVSTQCEHVLINWIHYKSTESEVEPEVPRDGRWKFECDGEQSQPVELPW